MSQHQVNCKQQYYCVFVFVIDEDEDGDRITVCSDDELTAMISFVSIYIHMNIPPHNCSSIVVVLIVDFLVLFVCLLTVSVEK